MVIGVGIPGESTDSIENFKNANGLDGIEFWIDNDHNYKELIQPGGRSFPIDLVVGKESQPKIWYLENAYYPGEAVKAAEDALKAQ